MRPPHHTEGTPPAGEAAGKREESGGGAAERELLLRAQRLEAVGQITGGITHDINNHLTVIISCAELLAVMLDKAARKERGHVAEIRRAAERSAVLLRQMLAFSRRQVSLPTALDLNELVGSHRKLFGLLSGVNVKVETRLAPDLRHALADPSRAEQLLFNLIFNAREAMPHGGVVTVSTFNEEPAEGGLFSAVSVEDTGEGMDEGVLARAFEPGFTTKGEHGARGAGLAAVREIVNEAGGRVRVESAPGRGTRLTVLLPSAADKGGEAKFVEEVKDYSRILGDETLLVVEDVDVVRKLTRDLLSNYGYKPVVAASGEEALRLYTEHGRSIALVLTDIKMPGMSGQELEVELRRLDPSVKVVFMSGYTDDEVLHREILTGEADFIAKPFDPEKLALKIREVLDRDKP